MTFGQQDESGSSGIGCLLVMVLGLAIGSVLFYSYTMRGGKDAGASAKRQAEPVPVTAAVATQKTIPLVIRAIANVEAYTTVAVKSQVNGELMRVCFGEGQDVKKGDLLFTIDPRAFEAELKEAEANLLRDEAKSKNAEREVHRYSRLAERDVASAEESEKTRADAEALRGQVLADQAAVENAKLEVEYCSIRSPVDGRTGSLMVNQGNIVKANDATLVVINQLTPIYVTFSVPEQYLLEIKKYMAEGKLKVVATVPGHEAAPVEGVVTFLDNEVDSTTGTIKLKATFANENKWLWPGQFVTVVMTLTSQPNAVLVPSHAVQTGQKGQYVYVVKPDLDVEYRPVTVTRTLDGESVIAEGIKPGERVVTDGHLRLVPGSKVEVKGGLETRL